MTAPDPPSYLCPKCGRRSYHPGDIAHRYCVICGFEETRALSAGLVEAELHAAAKGALERFATLRAGARLLSVARARQLAVVINALEVLAAMLKEDGAR